MCEKKYSFLKEIFIEHLVERRHCYMLGKRKMAVLELKLDIIFNLNC